MNGLVVDHLDFLVNGRTCQFGNNLSAPTLWDNFYCFQNAHYHITNMHAHCMRCNSLFIILDSTLVTFIIRLNKEQANKMLSPSSANLGISYDPTAQNDAHA